MSTESTDTVHNFLTHAERVIQDARFIVQSLPNAEHFSVERALRQLHAVHVVLQHIEDDWLMKEEIDGFIDLVFSVALPLEAFRDSPPPAHNTGTTTINSGRPGRPAYSLDLDRAVELHDMGNTWEGVAEAMGVRRRTLYYHLERAGMSSARLPFTEITDDALDEKVSEISLKHPLAGSSIVRGHLEAIGVHVPASRVEESLRRVDAVGVLLRYVVSSISFSQYYLSFM